MYKTNKTLRYLFLKLKFIKFNFFYKLYYKNKNNKEILHSKLEF